MIKQRNTVAVDLGRQADLEAMILAAGREVENLPGGIDVSLHEMPAKARVGREGPFEIHVASGLQLPERGDFEGAGQEIESRRFRIAGGHRQAAAVDRDRISAA